MYRADRLRGVMAAKRITSTKLSKKAGIGRPTISALMNGKDTRVSTLAAVAKALGVPLSYFFKEGSL